MGLHVPPEPTVAQTVMDAVATLNLVVSDPPTQAEMQQVVNKLDELITAQRR